MEPATVTTKDLSRLQQTGPWGIKSLTELDLSHNPFDDTGFAKLASCVEHLKELNTLILQHNKIGPAGANELAAYLAVTASLTSLDLSYNRLCGR